MASLERIFLTMEGSEFDPIDDVLTELRVGRPVIVTDDAGRENEGDLILAAEKATAENVAFMVRHTSGVICVPMEGRELDRLELPLMTPHAANTERMRTAYTISVDAAEGVTTGISAADRARTIRLLADPGTQPADLVRPGHILPLRYREGGVLRRAGHTEAAVDLARLAGLRPAGVLAEIVNDDEKGTMARVPDLLRFREQHGLKMCTIDALIAYRRQREKLVERVEVIQLPTDYGDFQLHLYRNKLDDKHHLALVKGRIDPDTPVPVRVHSECLTGDVFGSRRCDCGSQLHSALQQIEDAGAGALVYLRQSGWAAGLAGETCTHQLKEQNAAGVEPRLGTVPHLRGDEVGVQILLDLGVKKFVPITSSVHDAADLQRCGLERVEPASTANEPATGVAPVGAG